jgi:hypothetical protein
VISDAPPTRPAPSLPTPPPKAERHSRRYEPATLSVRQQAICRLAFAGLPPKVIAEQVHCHPDHVGRVLRTLAAKAYLAELAAVAKHDAKRTIEERLDKVLADGYATIYGLMRDERVKPREKLRAAFGLVDRVERRKGLAGPGAKRPTAGDVHARALAAVLELHRRGATVVPIQVELGGQVHLHGPGAAAGLTDEATRPADETTRAADDARAPDDTDPDGTDER